MSKHDKAVHAACASVGLPNLKIVADPADVAALEGKPECKVTFADALGLALEAFLTDQRGSSQGHDSAQEVVRSAPDSFGLGPTPTDAEITTVLRQLLASDPGAQIVLLGPTTIQEPKYRFPPEYGEGIEENWVFRIIAPQGWPLLQWAIVDLRAEKPAYSYSFD